MLNGLDLFSGIGGLTTALDGWVRPVAYCEQSKYCQSVLLSRMSEGSIGHAPIWNDVRTLNHLNFKWLSRIDIIYAGFPCQDISVAGSGRGLAGKRSALFFEIIRLTETISPTFVFVENVPAIRTRGLREVVSQFTDLGYDCRWTCVSAAELGAPHIRKRWFLLAHAQCGKVGMEPRRWSRSSGEEKAHLVDLFWKNTQPPDNRICDGLPEELDRIKALGNAVVPLQAQEAFKRLMGLKQ